MQGTIEVLEHGKSLSFDPLAGGRTITVSAVVEGLVYTFKHHVTYEQIAVGCWERAYDHAVRSGQHMIADMLLRDLFKEYPE